MHPRAADFAATIEANGQKILTLIENYLAGFRIESGTLASVPAPVDVAAVARDLLASAMFSAERCGCAFEEDLQGLPARAWLDEGLLYRALGNLLQNAIKHRQGDGAIGVIGRVLSEAESPLGKTSLQLAVENPAPTLSEDELKRAFRPYRRGRLAGGIEGSGIGLYVVAAAAKVMGGVARARMVAPDRVRFEMILPLLASKESAFADDPDDAHADAHDDRP
jgi:two-component system sensor histidine kinase KdpD